MQTAQTNSLTKKILKVGFDLDGVLLYNPARIVRPCIAIYKKLFFKRKGLHFYYPKTSIEKIMWKLLHKSSIYIAPGMNEIQKLVNQKKIRAYLVTARYGFMGYELLEWCKKNKLDRIFSKIYYNKQDEQPHLFKERMIKELDLDFFVEDNFDIVEHTRKKTPTSIIWIYNLFDRGIQYPLKFPYLKKAVLYIKELIDENRKPIK